MSDEENKARGPSSDESQEVVIQSVPPPKAKSAELTDIIEAAKALAVKDLAHESVATFLLQYLKEKLDLIRVLQAEITNLRSERDKLAIESAEKTQQLNLSSKARTLWVCVGTIGGVLAAGAFSISDNPKVFWVMLVAGVVLAVLGTVGTLK